MKCPNDFCGGKIEEHVNGAGQGSHYCLDGCGYYYEFITNPPRQRKAPERHIPRAPVRKPR